VNVYAATMSGQLSRSVAHLPRRVYVPNSEDGTIAVINPPTFRVVRRLRVAQIPHHVTPSWDLKRLYVDNEASGSLTVIDLPMDVRLAPDSSDSYVANQGRKGVSSIDPTAMKDVGFLPTAAGAHGLAVSRDTKSLYVGNRVAGTISVITFKTRRVAATWTVG